LSPLTQARNTLIDMRTQLEAQGQVVDARLEGRIKRQEKLIREMEAEEAAPAPTPEPEKINTPAPAKTRESPPAPAKVDTKGDGQPEIDQPDTMEATLLALESGDRIVRFRGSEFEERVWIAEVRKASGNTWVVKSKSADSPVTITKGPVGPDKRWGWGRSDAANKAIEGWVFEGDKTASNAEAKPEATTPPAPAATLSDVEAFSDDYAAFEGKTLEQPVQVEETGQTMTMRMEAATALRELDKRRKALEALKACLEKA
jgi:hypothetical protein